MVSEGDWAFIVEIDGELVAMDAYEFACRSRACAPPSAGGTGGSIKGDKGGSTSGPNVPGPSGSATGEIDVSRGANKGGEVAGGRSHEIDSMTPRAQKQMVEYFKGIPGFEKIKTPQEAVAIIKARLQATADLAAEQGYTPHMAQSAAKWYDVANDYAGKMVNEFGLKHSETAAGVLATLSPSAAWESNVYNARSIMKHVSENAKMGDEHVDYALSRSQRILADNRLVLKKDKKDLTEIDALIAEAGTPEFRAKLAGKIAGKNFNDLDDESAILVIHGHTQGTNAKGITLIPSPDGSYKVQDYSGKAIIQSKSNTLKALQMARADKNGASKEEMAKLISEKVSQESKVRAFYMNIARPNDRTQSAITADTHFFSAAVGIPLNANTAKPHFTGTTEIGFAKGYPAYRQAVAEMMPYLAQKFGVSPDALPRSGQSVLWEMERFLVPMKQKGEFIKNKGKMKTLEDLYTNGASAEEAKRYYFEQTGASVKDRIEGDIGE